MAEAPVAGGGAQATVGGELAGLSALLKEMEQRLTSRLDTVDLSVKALDGSVKALETRVNALDGSVKALETRVGKVESDIKSLKNTAGNISTNVGNVYELTARSRIEAEFGRSYARPFLVEDLFGLARIAVPKKEIFEDEDAKQHVNLHSRVQKLVWA
jgi:predicted nuclease with TOPRIM domain